MPSDVQEVVDVAAVLTHDETPGWVRRRLTDRPGTRWVGVDGFGAAGKTTLARRIAAALPGAQLLSVDHFGRADRSDWDLDLFNATVAGPLREGRPGRYQRWDLLSDRGLDWVEVPPGGPVVVEGVACTDVRVAVPWDVTLWVEAPRAVRRARVMARDDPALLARWRREWWPSEEAYAAAQQPWLRADAVVAHAGPTAELSEAAGAPAP